MCADFFELAETISIFQEEHVQYLHIDVMDGVFVPNLMLGTDFVRVLRTHTNIPLDIHLMIDNPIGKIEWFAPRENDIVYVHAESTPHVQRALGKIRNLGAKPAVAINPGTPLAAIEEVLCDVDAVLVLCVNPGFAGQKLVPQSIAKIKRLRAILDEGGFPDTEIAVDGNVTLENAKEMRDAGANIFTAGTSLLFRDGGTRTHIKNFFDVIK